MKNWEYVGCDIYKKWRVRVLYKEYLPEGETRKVGEKQVEMNFIVKHRFVYPYISGWYRGKWTHNPSDISKFPEQVQTFCKDTWTDRFKENYKRWRESVGPWVE